MLISHTHPGVMVSGRPETDREATHIPEVGVDFHLDLHGRPSVTPAAALIITPEAVQSYLTSLGQG